MYMKSGRDRFLDGYVGLLFVAHLILRLDGASLFTYLSTHDLCQALIYNYKHLVMR